MRLRGIVVLLAALALWASGVRARQGATVRDLIPGQPFEAELAGGESHSYRVTVTAGDLIRILVEQRGPNVGAILKRPDGAQALAVNLEIDRLKSEVVTIVADAGGPWTLDVRPVSAVERRGPYVVRLEPLRTPDENDLLRVKAHRDLERGDQLFKTLTPSEFPKALEAMQTAHDGFAGLGDRSGELRALLSIAEMEMRLNRASTIETSRRAEALARTLRDETSLAWALGSLGQGLGTTGDSAGALAAFDEATEVFRRLDNPRAEAVVLANAGILHAQAGNLERALVDFQRVVQVDGDWGRSNVASLNNLGLTYKNLGEWTKALETYQQALTALGPPSPQTRNPRATILNNMGNLQHLLGDDRQALGLQQQALALAREAGSKENEARSLNTIGQRYFSLGDDTKALEHQQESLAIRRSLDDPAALAASLDATGRTLHRLGQLPAAFDMLTEALALRRRVDRASEPDTLHNLAELERDRGNFAVAIERIKTAVDLDETHRARITSPELRASFVASELDNYELYIDLLQQQHDADPGGGYAAAALQVSERARARVLLESLLDARVDLRSGIEPALLEKERALQKQLRTASQQLSRAQSAPGRAEPPAELVRNFERLTTEYQEHLAVIRRQSPHYAAVTQPEPLATADIQRSLLDANTVLLEFWLGEKHSWLWAVSPTAVTSVALAPRRDVDAAARSFHELLTARQRRSGESTADYAKRVSEADARRPAHAAALSRLLLGGIDAALQNEWRGKRLVIVATGSLEYVPFGLVPIPGSTALLASRHEIVRAPSASVLAVLRRESADRKPAPRQLAILADPVFDATDPRVSAPAPALRSSAPANDAIESLYVRAGLSRLPFSREEANAITALAEPKGVFKATDFGANRTAALGGALAGYRIVHFATHGILDSARPAVSGLVLSLVDEQGRRQDGFLRQHDIYNMRLDADLVVLSACQTALGKDIKGEGLIGLTRAFMYAGAPRVVSSLWEVNDLATAELMKRFYRGMLQQQLTPAAALRAAQLEMSRDARWASPYYWAGFVFQGDWK